MNGARAVNVLSSFTVIAELEIPSSSNLKHKVSQNKKRYAGKKSMPARRQENKNTHKKRLEDGGKQYWSIRRRRGRRNSLEKKDRQEKKICREKGGKNKTNK